jgi:hypothetical protein
MLLECLYRVDVDGTITELDASEHADRLRAAIGGYIERVMLVPGFGPNDDPGLDMWADEEGLLKALSPNPVATVLCRVFGGGQTIVGPVVVAGSIPPNVVGCPEGTGVELRRIAAYVLSGGDA